MKKLYLGLFFAIISLPVWAYQKTYTADVLEYRMGEVDLTRLAGEAVLKYNDGPGTLDITIYDTHGDLLDRLFFSGYNIAAEEYTGVRIERFNHSQDPLIVYCQTPNSGTVRFAVISLYTYKTIVTLRFRFTGEA